MSEPMHDTGPESHKRVALPERNATALREDLVKEYLAVVDVVGTFDARVMTVKGWSVTLSLAAR